MKNIPAQIREKKNRSLEVAKLNNIWLYPNKQIFFPSQ